MIKSGSGKGYTKNLLLAATIVSLSTTMIMQTPVKAETLAEAIANATTTSYTMTGNYTFTDDAGSLAVNPGQLRFLMVSSDTGNTYTIDGGGHNGIEIGNHILVLTNVNVQNFTTALSNSGSLMINGVTFSNNSVADIINEASLTLNGNNTINTIRAVIPSATTSIIGGTTTIASNGSVTQNAINMQGGRLLIDYGANIAADIVGDENYSVTTNTSGIAAQWGGALQNRSGYYGSVNSIKGTFKGNSLNSTNTTYQIQVAGGAISTGSQITEGINATFIDNQATTIEGNAYGGALKINDSATIPSVVGTFTGNKAISYTDGSASGGAISNDTTVTSGISGTFTNNSAQAPYTASGGAVSNGRQTTAIVNSTFTSNSATASNSYARGGAVYTYGNITDSTFTSNSATSTNGSAQGGAVYVDNAQTISGSTFTGNTVTAATASKAKGSAVYVSGRYDIYTDTYSENNIIGSTFTENGAGGALYVASGHTTVKDSNFTDNLGDAIVFADDNWTFDEYYNMVYYPVKGDIIAEAANVAITGNSGWGIVGNNNHETDSALTLYAKSGNITINGNTAGGINNNGLVLTLNADTGHNITINDAVSSTTGMTVNDGGTHAGTVALNGALTLGGDTNIQGGTLKLGTGAATSNLNAVTFANTPTLDLQNSSAQTTTVTSISGNANLNIDIDFTGDSVIADAINITTGGGTGGTLTINDINVVGTLGNFEKEILTGTTTGVSLALSSAVTTEFNTSTAWEDKSSSDALTQNATWNDTFNSTTWEERTNKTISVVDNTKLRYSQSTETRNEQVTTGDNIALLNQASQFGAVERKYTTDNATKTHTATADFGTTAAGKLTIQGATDGTNTSTIDLNGKNGFTIGSGAEVTLDTVKITGAKAETGSLINNTAGTVNLKNAEVTTNASDIISNNNILNVEDSTINSGITGSNGTTNVKGTSIIDRISQKIVEIFTGANLETQSIAATNGVTNAGDLKITGTSNTSNITGTGTTEFTNNVNNSGSITQNTVKIASGKTLTTTGDITVSNTLTNNGTITLNSADTKLNLNGGSEETPMAVAGTINGTGKTVINGIIDNNGTIASAVKIETGSLSTNASKVTGGVENNASEGLVLTGGDLASAISGTGSTSIEGAVTNTGNNEIANAVIIASGGSLSTDASKVTKGVENNATNGLDLTGGDLASNITGTGTTVISGTVTNDNGKSLGTDMTVSGSLQTNASQIGGDISGTGSVDLTGGTLSKEIASTGGITISGNTSANADKLKDAATVSGGQKLTVTGGTITKAIGGTGNLDITGNTTSNIANGISGAVTVAENVELAIGTNNDVFSSASSVTMGNGSTLNLQNGSAVATNIDKVVVGADDTVKLAIDWNDQINSSNPTNIAGNLQVSSVDLTGTDGTKQSYQLTTTLQDKISLANPLDIQGTGVSNFVKYHNDSSSANYGKLTSYQNSLIMAVTDTDSGEVATYNMTVDETAGGGTLEGSLKVQGNGHSITTGGIVIGSTTIQNAELTLEDTNLKNITGDAITVYGGNKGHIVANTQDVAITANTGNAIKLIANGTNYAEMDIDAGSKTITIDNYIISDDSNNKVTFKGGNVQFNGKFDPAMGVVGGATVTRGGDDDGIDWTVTSGTLNYLQDSYLNRATNTMNLNGGTLNTINGVVTDFALGSFTLSADSNFYADVDLANQKMDNFLNTPTTYTGGTLHVAGLNLISDAAAVNTSIPFANSTLAGHVDYTGAQGLTALSPIYKYNVGYDNTTGNFDFTRYNTGGYGDYNPAVLASPVAAQLGGYLTQLNSYDEAFRNMDMYMLMTASQRQALKNKNKIASIDGGVLYDATLMRQERAEGWFRPYATFENVPLKNGPKVSNVAYGTFMGGESEMYDLGHGWDGMWGAYVGYNGSHQAYNGISIYQNGGTLGALGMAYKGNFFTGLTINAGANAGEANTMYGNDNFSMLMAGIASKTGYNWELANGKFIIQPSWLMSYSFINTFDYTNAAGVRIDSDPLHAIQLQPEIKFIGNLKNGWQPYASVAMVWNIMDDTKFKANNVSLPELSVKPFVKYGVGVRKTWGERFTGFFQTYLTNGGRNGVGLQAGFTWTFGKKGDPIDKKTSKTPEMKKTTITLNGNRVQ